MASILTCYYRPKPGGCCERLFRAMRALIERGHSVHYLAVAPFPVKHPRCFFHRFPWPSAHASSLLFWIFFHLMAPLWLIAIAMRHRITHAFAFGATYAFLLQPLRMVKSVIITCFMRGDAILVHRLARRFRLLIALDSFIEGLGCHGTRVVSVSRRLLFDVLVRHPLAIPAQCLVLPNDLPAIGDAVRGESNASFRIGLVGKLEAHKNPDFALRLLTAFSAESFRLIVFGSGSQEKRLRFAAKRKGISDRVSFMGWQPPEVLWPQVDVLIAPSLTEGMPNAVLEAIARRIPVVASDIAAHRELLPANQVLSLDDIHPWVDLLNAIFLNRNVLPEQMAERQLRNAERLRFDWDQRVCDIILSSTK